VTHARTLLGGARGSDIAGMLNLGLMVGHGGCVDKETALEVRVRR
jgi:hypothetical protein